MLRMNLNARITALRKVTKPYRAKLNDQIAKIVGFPGQIRELDHSKVIYFRMIKIIDLKPGQS